MNALDFFVLIASILSIAIYGIWHTRNRSDLSSYVRGSDRTPWYVIGLSVMATQASAITFLSTPGQGYLSGLSFVQIYFGVPLALIIIAAFFLPNFHKLNVYTAYEFLEKRFDSKTRLLGAGLFLLQRGLGAGLTIYAPAIVLTSVFGWELNATIICSGLIVLVYTVLGGCDAVNVTQKYQMIVIFTGMVTAFCLLISRLPANLSVSDTLHLAGGFHKLNAINFSTDPNERYTLWSGLIGGTFLMLSYFGTDQSQVQRYLSGHCLREGRLGLLFNAICKIPMQFAILLLGVLMFVFYQFQQPPLFFDAASSHYLSESHPDAKLVAYENQFKTSHSAVRNKLNQWVQLRHSKQPELAQAALIEAQSVQEKTEQIRTEANAELAKQHPHEKANDADYVFVTFILNELPHGVIGLLIAAFFAAALSSKAAELNALGTCTTIDFYRHIVNRDANDSTCLIVTKWSTAVWGVIAIVVALYAHLAENLIQAVNILGSIFYGVMLALFLVGFFIKRVSGTAIFWAAVIAQTLVITMYLTLKISYLWYPLIGCCACIALSLFLQAFSGKNSTTIPNSANDSKSISENDKHNNQENSQENNKEFKEYAS